MKSIQDIAAANLQALRENPYPGRGLILGRNDEGYLVQAAWTMGRSPGSRNRVYEIDGDFSIRTAVADHSQETGNLDLIIYRAMAEGDGGLYVVSNGKQTDLVVRAGGCEPLYNELHGEPSNNPLTWYEPDEPNFTPRITGVQFVRRDGSFPAQISVLRKSPFSGDCERCHYQYDNPALGFGYCVHTYMGDGNPLPSFQGEPYLLPLNGDEKAIATELWDHLDPANRVSLAVKLILSHEESLVAIKNQYEQVAV